MDPYSRSTTAVVGMRGDTAARQAVHVCAECRYAEAFAQRQPRAFCSRPGGLRAGQCVFAGQPACTQFAARPVA